MERDSLQRPGVTGQGRNGSKLTERRFRWDIGKKFFTIRAYVNKFSGEEGEEGDHEWDLLALRFLSINSIVDPWVFAILRPSVLRLMRSVLCCQVTPTAPGGPAVSPAVTKLPRPELCGQ
ncbi:prostaglandin E2 receptor EP2 subtype [Turdus rufiventris]|nr:prostaglandin E2 receptor EP2 subtype [Turdus rufiventris]